MATWNLFPKEVPIDEGAVEGGTLAEWLAREVVEPSVPASTLAIKLPVTEHGKIEIKGFVIPAGLATELAGSAKVVAATLHISCKTSAGGKRMKFGFVTAAVFVEPEVKAAQTWFTVALSKAQAETLTKTGLEELKVLIEKLTATASLVNIETYLSLETEVTSGPRAITGTFTGSGLFVPKVNTPLKAAGSFVGTSGIVDKPNAPQQVAATFPGAAVFAATPRTPRQLVAAFAGSSAFAAIARTPRQLVAAFAGAGSFVARVTVPAKLRQAFAGAGGFLAQMTIIKAVTGQAARTRIVTTNEPTRVHTDGSEATRAVIE